MKNKKSKLFKDMDKLKNTLFEDLGEMLKPLTEKEKKALVAEAKAKDDKAKNDYATRILGGHMTGLGFWSED